MHGPDMTGVQFSLISALRTGHFAVDLAIALLVPIIIKFFCVDAARMARLVFEHLYARARRDDRYCTRTISCVSVGSSVAGREHKNNVLQKAIALYLTEVNKGRGFERQAQVALTAVLDMSIGSGPVDRFDPLSKFRLTWLAPENTWSEIEEGLWFQQRTTKDGGDNEEGDKATRERLTYEFQCKVDGPAKIDGFIDRALEWYKAELLRLRDDARYMYNLVSTTLLTTPEGMPGRRGGVGSEAANGFRFKKYRLSDHKTFESLFLPEKDALLGLLDDFSGQTGKYEIAGYPHKLGLLLHGPPGTGKTSLIKALAHHTQRSVINIPLSRLSTNQQLMDIMFDLRLSVVAQDMPVSLTFRDVIFVIEDVDAASSIVQKRHATLAAPAAAGAPGETSGPTPGSSAVSERSGAAELRTLFNDDPINLAGLLNVLDGVVDTPGRILVMTTNHPEALDPALIRPGRIDKQILLDYIQADAAAAMLTHYYSATQLAAAQRARLGALLGEAGMKAHAPARALRLTPAAMEQLCAEHATVDAILDCLAERALSFFAASDPVTAAAGSDRADPTHAGAPTGRPTGDGDESFATGAAAIVPRRAQSHWA